jgi:hypothetical protein
VSENVANNPYVLVDTGKIDTISFLGAINGAIRVHDSEAPLLAAMYHGITGELCGFTSSNKPEIVDE